MNKFSIGTYRVPWICTAHVTCTSAHWDFSTWNILKSLSCSSSQPIILELPSICLSNSRHHGKILLAVAVLLQGQQEGWQHVIPACLTGLNWLGCASQQFPCYQYQNHQNGHNSAAPLPQTGSQVSEPELPEKPTALTYTEVRDTLTQRILLAEL